MMFVQQKAVLYLETYYYHRVMKTEYLNRYEIIISYTLYYSVDKDSQQFDNIRVILSAVQTISNISWCTLHRQIQCVFTATQDPLLKSGFWRHVGVSDFL